MNAVFVGPPSGRRFFLVSAARKDAGETPAEPEFGTSGIANSDGVAGGAVIHAL